MRFCALIGKVIIRPKCTCSHNLTKVRPLFSYRMEDLITPHNWSCSVLIILTNPTEIHVSESISEVLTFGPFKSGRTTCWRWLENVNYIIFKNTAISLNYAIWLIKIMTQYPNYKVYTKFTWTRSVMGSYQIL